MKLRSQLSVFPLSSLSIYQYVLILCTSTYKIRGPQKVGERRIPPSRLRIRLKVRGMQFGRANRGFLGWKVGCAMRKQHEIISALKVLMSGPSRHRCDKDFRLCNAHLDRGLEASPERSAVMARKVLYDGWVEVSQTLPTDKPCEKMNDAQREAFIASRYPNGYRTMTRCPRMVHSLSLLERRRMKAHRANGESDSESD